MLLDTANDPLLSIEASINRRIIDRSFLAPPLTARIERCNLGAKTFAAPRRSTTDQIFTPAYQFTASINPINRSAPDVVQPGSIRSLSL